MTLLITVLGAIAFFALIIGSVLMHELGHLIPAKIFGVKVTQFFAGFGPTIWSTKRGETEYGFKWIPLGGFCKLIGMFPPRKSGVKDTWLQRVADSGRESEFDDIEPADEGRLFYQKKTWQKLIVMSGGITVNLIIAFILFQSVFGLVGVQQPSRVVANVSECMIAGAKTVRSCNPSDPVSPAKQAGVQVGDQVVSFNGHKIDDWRQLSDLIRANKDGAANIVVLRDGKEVALKQVHTVITGVPDRLDPAKTIQAGFLGFTPQTERVKLGPIRTLGQMWNMSVMSLNALATLPTKVFNVAVDIVKGHPRDPASPMSIVGASRVAGDITATDTMKWTDKVASGAMLLGSLNLFLFWLNIIPLPPMDGGHMAGAIYEWARRGIARLRGKPDPGHFDTAKMTPVSIGMFVVLTVLGVVLILADVISPLKLF